MNDGLFHRLSGKRTNWFCYFLPYFLTQSLTVVFLVLELAQVVPGLYAIAVVSFLSFTMLVGYTRQRVTLELKLRFSEINISPVQTRNKKGIPGNLMEDILLSTLFYPNVILQMDDRAAKLVNRMEQRQQFIAVRRAATMHLPDARPKGMRGANG